MSKEAKICDRCGRAAKKYHKEIVQPDKLKPPSTWIICEVCESEGKHALKKL